MLAAGAVLRALAALEDWPLVEEYPLEPMDAGPERQWTGQSQRDVHRSRLSIIFLHFVA